MLQLDVLLGIDAEILLAPHVGHLYTLVLTDILKRWHVLQGRKAILCTGTDEHGMKVSRETTKFRCETEITRLYQIQQAAAKAGQDVRSFCDEMSQSFDVGAAW